MSLIHSISGTIVMEVTSANIPGTMDILCKKGILLQDVSHLDDFTIRFRISRASCKTVSSTLEERGDSFRVISREGVYWNLRAMIDRPVLLLGCIFFAFWVFFLPSRIFFVEVEGNDLVNSRRILCAASDLGVKFGASRRFVKSEQVKNGLLSAVEELEWAGVNTRGCVATISVREHPLDSTISAPQVPGHLVAARDGVILSCDVTRGNSLCIPGQAVKAGDILISGVLDQGLTSISIMAEGEIFASTERIFSAICDGTIQKREAINAQKEKYSLLIGKKLINFFKGSGISGGTCVKMYSKYVLTLPGGFRLPVTLVKQSIVSCALSDEMIEENRAYRLLSDFSDRYIRDQMIAGQILNASKESALLGDAYQLTGTYACAEMIGRMQQEQIGAYNGKTD